MKHYHPFLLNFFKALITIYLILFNWLVCCLSAYVAASLSLFSTYFTINDCPSFHFQTEHKEAKGENDKIR